MQYVHQTNWSTNDRSTEMQLQIITRTSFFQNSPLILAMYTEKLYFS